MPKIYTKRGDTGFTDLYRGTRADRRSKTDDLFFLLGKLDELSVKLGGIANGIGTDQLLDTVAENIEYLRVIQQVIIEVSAEIQSPGSINGLDTTVDIMESMIDRLTEELPPLTRFLLTVASHEDLLCQTARVTCREAERLTVQYYTKNSQENWSDATPEILKFINRLSDYLFTLGRYVVHTSNNQPIESNRQLIVEYREKYSS